MMLTANANENNGPKDYADISREVKPAVASKRRTTIKLFQEYVLKKHNLNREAYPFQELTPATAQLMDTAFVGGFPNFLLEKNPHYELNTIDTYLSNLFTCLKKEYGMQLSKDFCDDAKHQAGAKIKARNIAQGRSHSKRTPAILPSELFAFCSILFQEDSMQSIAIRAAFILQFQTFGRVSESTHVFCQNLHLLDESLIEQANSRTIAVSIIIYKIIVNANSIHFRRLYLTVPRETKRVTCDSTCIVTPFWCALCMLWQVR